MCVYCLKCVCVCVPECIPARICSCVLGLWGILKVRQTPTRSRAMLAISAAWRIPFSWGTPDTTMSAEPGHRSSHLKTVTHSWLTLCVCVCVCVWLTGVPDGFHLVDVVVVDDVVKCGVELVEEVYDLVRSAAAGELREAHDVATHTHTHTVYCLFISFNSVLP